LNPDRERAVEVEADQLVAEDLPCRSDDLRELAVHDGRRVDKGHACMMAASYPREVRDARHDDADGGSPTGASGPG
jgi:hypothetical protein